MRKPLVIAQELLAAIEADRRLRTSRATTEAAKLINILRADASPVPAAKKASAR